MTEEKLTFHNHPLKSDIVQRWENGEKNKHIWKWLLEKHPTLVLSTPTLCKHYRNFKRNKKKLPSVNIDAPPKINDSEIEKILWQTIKDCQRLKQDGTLSPKDWQYLDQQQQNALEKLIRIQDKTGDTRDISTVLTEIFKRMELGIDVDVGEITGRELSEKEKREIAEEVDEAALEVDVETEE